MGEKRTKQAQGPGPDGPGSWLATEVGNTDPGSEAWSLMHWMMVTNKQRMFAIGHEF